jgi:tRNA-binding EMAP/Myf-like protein
MVFKNKKKIFKIITVLIIIVFIISFLSIMMQPKQMQVEGFLIFGSLKPSTCKPCPSQEMILVPNNELSQQDSSSDIGFIANTKLSNSSSDTVFIDNTELSQQDSSQELISVSKDELSKQDSSSDMSFIPNNQIPCSGLRFSNLF